MAYYVLTLPHATGVFTNIDSLMYAARRVKGQDEINITFRECVSREEIFITFQKTYCPEVLFLFGMENLYNLKLGELYWVRAEEIQNCWKENEKNG